MSYDTIHSIVQRDIIGSMYKLADPDFTCTYTNSTVD
jgi:hypothetical protein